jgi:hypothetical protein
LPVADRKEVMNMQCIICSCTGLEGTAHFHIVVEKGKVTTVHYMSASGYWDRELGRGEYFVEYKEDEKGEVPANPDPAKSDWLIPKLYKGKSMHEEELE